MENSLDSPRRVLVQNHWPFNPLEELEDAVIYEFAEWAHPLSLDHGFWLVNVESTNLSHALSNTEGESVIMQKRII